jgi:hypothetical protein
VHASSIDILACQYVAASFSYVKKSQNKKAPEVLFLQMNIKVPSVMVLFILEKDHSEMPILEASISDQVFVVQGTGPASVDIQGEIKFQLKYFDSKRSEWENMLSHGTSQVRMKADEECGRKVSISTGSEMVASLSLTAMESIHTFLNSLALPKAAPFPAHESVKTFHIHNRTGISMYLFDHVPSRNDHEWKWKECASAFVESGQSDTHNWKHRLTSEGPTFQVFERAYERANRPTLFYTIADPNQAWVAESVHPIEIGQAQVVELNFPAGISAAFAQDVYQVSQTNMDGSRVTTAISSGVELENKTGFELEVMGENVHWGDPVVLGSIRGGGGSMPVSIAYADVSEIRFRPSSGSKYHWSTPAVCVTLLSDGEERFRGQCVGREEGMTPVHLTVDVIKQKGVTTIYFLPTALLINDLPQAARCAMGSILNNAFMPTQPSIQVEGSSSQEVVGAFTHMTVDLGAGPGDHKVLISPRLFETTLTDTFGLENANGNRVHIFSKVQKRLGQVMTITLSAELLVVDNTLYSKASMCVFSDGRAWRSLCDKHPNYMMINAGKDNELRFGLRSSNLPANQEPKWSSSTFHLSSAAGDGPGAAEGPLTKVLALMTPDQKNLWVVAHVKTVPVKSVLLSNLVSIASVAKQHPVVIRFENLGHCQELLIGAGKTVPLHDLDGMFAANPDASNGHFLGNVQVSLPDFSACVIYEEVQRVSSRERALGTGATTRWSDAFRIEGIQQTSQVHLDDKRIVFNLRRLGSLTDEYVLFVDVQDDAAHFAPVKSVVMDDPRSTLSAVQRPQLNRRVASVSIRMKKLETRLFHQTSEGIVYSLVSLQTQHVELRLNRGTVLDEAELTIGQLLVCNGLKPTMPPLFCSEEQGGNPVEGGRNDGKAFAKTSRKEDICLRVTVDKAKTEERSERYVTFARVVLQSTWVCRLDLGFLMRLLLCKEEVFSAKQAKASQHQLRLLDGTACRCGTATLPSLLFLKDFGVSGTKVALTLQLSTYDTATETKARLLLKKQAMQVGGEIPIRVALPDLEVQNQHATQKSLMDTYFRKLKNEIDTVSLLYDIGGKAAKIGLGGRAWSGREKGAGGTGNNFWEDISRKMAKDNDDNAPDLGWKFRAHKLDDHAFFSKHRRLCLRLGTYPQFLRQLEHVCYDWSYNHATVESRNRCAVVGIVNRSKHLVVKKLHVDMQTGAGYEWLSSSTTTLKPRRSLISAQLEGHGDFACLIAWSHVPTVFNGSNSELAFSVSSSEEWSLKLVVLNGEVHTIESTSSASSSIVDDVSARVRASVEVSDVFKWWSRTVITIYDDDELLLNARGSRDTTHAKCFASLDELIKEKDRISVRNSKLSCALLSTGGRGIKSVVKEEVWQNQRYAYSVGGKPWGDIGYLGSADPPKWSGFDETTWGSSSSKYGTKNHPIISLEEGWSWDGEWEVDYTHVKTSEHGMYVCMESLVNACCCDMECVCVSVLNRFVRNRNSYPFA